MAGVETGNIQILKQLDADTKTASFSLDGTVVVNDVRTGAANLWAFPLVKLKDAAGWLKIVRHAEPKQLTFCNSAWCGRRLDTRWKESSDCERTKRQ